MNPKPVIDSMLHARAFPSICQADGAGMAWRPSSIAVAVWLGLAFFGFSSAAAIHRSTNQLWSLKPVVQPTVPTESTTSPHPIDAFIAAGWKAKGLQPAPKTDRQTLLRRVTLDLTGLPPTVEEQTAFLEDGSPGAYERVVDRLLASEQHAVSQARRWLDVLRYADEDEHLDASRGLHHWRDWVIQALHDDVPYDQFVRAQLTGYRSTVRTEMVATGQRHRIEPRPDDLFALGFLARGAVLGNGPESQNLAIAAVETVSTAFLGMTVGCAKCHDHMYDPISKRDFYAMKALFDPLVPRRVVLAGADQLIARGKAEEAAARGRRRYETEIEELVGPTRQRLYDERVAMLPPEIQTVIRKPERLRSPEEQKIADGYYPILRIDSDKVMEALPEEKREPYRQLQRKRDEENGKRGPALATFWTVERDRAREQEKSYILTSGEPDRPEKNHEVGPGWPFTAELPDFRDGRVEAFSDWLTSPDNPLFARVAVNRLWQWHFGAGLQKTASDFGELGGVPSHPELLDWLAAEFVRMGFSLKAMHRRMVLSETYQLASEMEADGERRNQIVDADDQFLWRSRLRRLDAEALWDSIHQAAGLLNLAVGGPSFSPGDGKPVRRGIYIVRGYSANRDVLPAFLQAFDVDDGRTPCPLRTQTVTAPQALFLMNSPEIQRAADALAARIQPELASHPDASLELAFRTVLGRPPTSPERDLSVHWMNADAAQLPGFAWMLFNLDEFLYVR